LGVPLELTPNVKAEEDELPMVPADTTPKVNASEEDAYAFGVPAEPMLAVTAREEEP
jgi:hypothetical protein